MENSLDSVSSIAQLKTAHYMAALALTIVPSILVGAMSFYASSVVYQSRVDSLIRERDEDSRSMRELQQEFKSFQLQVTSQLSAIQQAQSFMIRSTVRGNSSENGNRTR